MANILTATTMLQCSFGAAPSPVMVAAPPTTLVEAKPPVVITDTKPLVNIVPFGMCSSLANPTVASATAAALGVLTPMPCVPNIVSPWAPPASKTLIGGMPAATIQSMCSCAWGGVVKPIGPGAPKTLAN